MSAAEQKSARRIPVLAKHLRLTGDETQGVLLGVRCRSCGQYLFGSPVFCPKCMSSELGPVELSQRGILRTFTVIWAPPPGWQGSVPYILGAVELPEGPEVVSEVVDCPREAIKVGMPMELALRIGGKDKEGNEVVVYKWRPASA
jgi:uncharacterized OB-fold protein